MHNMISTLLSIVSTLTMWMPSNDTSKAHVFSNHMKISQLYIFDLLYTDYFIYCHRMLKSIIICSTQMRKLRHRKDTQPRPDPLPKHGRSRLWRERSVKSVPNTASPLLSSSHYSNTRVLLPALCPSRKLKDNLFIVVTGNQNTQMSSNDLQPYITASLWVWTGPVNRTVSHVFDYIILHGRGDFTGVIEVLNQLILSWSRAFLQWVWPNQATLWKRGIAVRWGQRYFCCLWRSQWPCCREDDMAGNCEWSLWAWSFIPRMVWTESARGTVVTLTPT